MLPVGANLHDCLVKLEKGSNVGRLERSQNARHKTQQRTQSPLANVGITRVLESVYACTNDHLILSLSALVMPTSAEALSPAAALPRPPPPVAATAPPLPRLPPAPAPPRPSPPVVGFAVKAAAGAEASGRGEKHILHVAANEVLMNVHYKHTKEKKNRVNTFPACMHGLSKERYRGTVPIGHRRCWKRDAGIRSKNVVWPPLRHRPRREKRCGVVCHKHCTH